MTTNKSKSEPVLRFPGFKGEWKLQQLSELADFRNGKAHEQAITENGEYVVVNSRFISTEGRVLKYSDMQIAPLEKGEVTMVMSDVPRGRALAKCYFVEQDNVYSLNQRICALKATGSLAKFLFYRVNRNRYFLEFDSGVGQTNLRKDEVLDCPLRCPETLPEQRKIADFLTSVDDRIGQLIQKKALLEEYKKGVMQQLFTQAIRFKDDQGNDFPDWEEKKLKAIARIYDGTHSTPAYTDTGVPFYSVEHLTRGSFHKTKFISEAVFEKENKRVKLERGDVLMTRIGDIGTSRHLDWDVRASFYVSLALIKLQQNLMIPEFAHQSISARYFQLELWKRTIHVAFPKKINLGEIGECEIKVPSLAEQTKIADFLSAIDRKIEAVANQITETQTYKRGLLQQMFV